MSTRRPRADGSTRSWSTSGSTGISWLTVRSSTSRSKWNRRSTPTSRSPETHPPSTRSLTARVKPKYARDRLAELTPAELKVLVTWVKANRSIEDTAILLDRHRNAVSARLYKASAKLMLSLTHPGGAVNDLLWLLVLAGHLPAEFVRDPVSAGAGQAIRPARVPDAQR